MHLVLRQESNDTIQGANAAHDVSAQPERTPGRGLLEIRARRVVEKYAMDRWLDEARLEEPWRETHRRGYHGNGRKKKT